jgi:thermitase
MSTLASRRWALPATLAALALAACGGGGAGLGGSDGFAPEKPEAVLMRVDTDTDLDALEREVAADGWDVARTYGIPPSETTDGAFLCVLEAIPGATLVYPEGCEPLRTKPRQGDKTKDDAAKVSAKAASERVRPMAHGRRFGGDQSYVPIFDDDVNFLAFLGQDALRTIGGHDPRFASAGAGVRIAILDGGFDLGHEALAGRVAPGYDAVADDFDPQDLGDGLDGDGDGVPDDLLGHGTAVAALALAVAPQAVVVPIRVLDDEGWGSTATVSIGFLAAIDAGVHVINLSSHADKSSSLVTDLVALARARGILVVASAGNSGDPHVGFPACLPDAVALGGATGGMYDPASDYGPEIDVSAPVRDVLAPFPATRDGYARWSGTSMSAALFSGAVAAGLSLDALSTPHVVRDRLLASPSPYVMVPSSLRDRVGRGVLRLQPLLP